MSKKTIMMLCLAMMSWGAYAQHNHDNSGKEMNQQMEPEFQDKNLGTAYSHYISLKDALVASKSDAAKNAATDLQQSLDAIDNGNTAQAEAEKVAAAASLNEQRTAFAALTDEMAKLVKAGAISEGEVHLTYCPMANNSKGGYWLSNNKEIRNPYFGDKMLKCGSIKETIN